MTMTQTDRRPWDLAIDAGVVLFTVGALVTQAVLAGEVIPPLVILPVLLLATLALRRRRHKAGVIASLVLAVVAVFGNAPFVIDDLTHASDAPLQFAVSVAMLVGLITTIVGAVASLRDASGAALRPYLGGAAAVVVIGAVAAGVIATGTDSDTAQEGDVVLVTKDIEFQPENLTVAAGGAVFVDNDDLVRHTFTVDDTDIDLQVPASTARRVVVDLEPGTYEFTCEVPGHESMEGTLVVE